MNHHHADRLPSPIVHASAWKPGDFAHDDSWLHLLDDAQKAQARNAARSWAGRDFRSLTREEAARNLSLLAPVLETLDRELATRGFAMLRGLPVQDMSRDGAALVYWAIGAMMGTGMSQNAAADFICSVTDMGVDFGYSGTATQRNVRGYQSRADLNYHCDPTDVVALLCIKKAMTGGSSTIVSTPSIYNEILRSQPEHLPVLERGFVYDRKGEQGEGDSPVTPRIPVFVRHGDRLSTRYARSYILGGAQKLGVALTAQETAALDAFDATARRSDMALHMSFEPGDVQFLNNLTVVHGRTAYEDSPDPAQKRFLYRLWLDLGERAPWADEDEVMRRAFARFGRLGRTVQELETAQ